MALQPVLVYILLLSAVLVHRSCATEGAGLKSSSPKSANRQLKRSAGQRWTSINEVIRAEIKSATKHFLEERSRALILPIEVDLLLVGFDGDGGYGYSINQRALDELLGTATEDNTICPTVWETGESAAVCFSVNYITLDSAKSRKGIERMENALVHNMEWVGDRSQDWPDGSREVQVYEVEANGEIEATVWELLDEAYGGKEPEVNRRQHSQIVIINPSKLRMKSMVPQPPGHGDTHHDVHVAAAQQARADMDFIAEWKNGMIGSGHVVEQEAGFLYRYRYNGRGGGAAFVGQYNFLVIDISAGPVSYGPLASPSGAVAPTAMPRLMPMLLRMTRELEANTQAGTLREHLLDEAAKGQAAVFAGQLASTVAAATRHLFATDMLMAAAEGMGGAAYADGPKRVVVPIIVMQDHVRELEHENEGARWVDVDMVQLALDEMLPPDVHGAVSVSRHMLHHHRQLAAALVKARHSRSDAVLSKPPDVGLHRSQTTSLDAAVLLRELRLAAADDELMSGLVEHMMDDYVHRLPYGEDAADFMARKKHESKVIPVFVFSLERSPEQMMFDNQQLVAAGGDVVAVLQLLGSAATDDFSRGRVYSGHMAEGHHLLIDAGDSPSRAIIAGLATALGGLVPAHQRYCTAERAVVEDWRWSVGAVPWGPYSNYTALSSVFAATARRNILVGRIEKPLRQLIAALDRIDQFIVKHLQGPFAFLRRATRPVPYASGDPAGPLHDFMPDHHLLDDLARQHVKYWNASSSAKSIVRNLLGAKDAKPAAGQSPSPAAGDKADQHTPADDHHTEDQHQEHQQHANSDEVGFIHDYPEDMLPHHEGPYDHQDEYDGTYDHPHLLSPEVMAARETAFTSAKTGAGKLRPPNPADLVVDQQVLTPNVAHRLQVALNDIGNHLEQISFLMYSRNWAELEDVISPFTASVTSFVGGVDRDLQHANEVVSCCDVRHVPRGSATWFLVGLVLVVLGAFGITAYVVIRSQKIYQPNIVRTPSRGRSLSGSLPSWSGPSGTNLPR